MQGRERCVCEEMAEQPIGCWCTIGKDGRENWWEEDIDRVNRDQVNRRGKLTRDKRKVGRTLVVAVFVLGTRKRIEWLFHSYRMHNCWSISQIATVLETRNKKEYGNKLGRSYLRSRIRLNEVRIRRYIPLGSMFEKSKTPKPRETAWVSLRCAYQDIMESLESCSTLLS